MDKKTRDVVLAVLSVGGALYLIDGVYASIIDILAFRVSLPILRFLVLFESAIFLAAGYVVYKKVEVSDVYKKYFGILFIIAVILDLLRKIIVIF